MKKSSSRTKGQDVIGLCKQTEGGTRLRENENSFFECNHVLRSHPGYLHTEWRDPSHLLTLCEAGATLLSKLPIILNGDFTVDFSKDKPKPLVDFLKSEFNLIMSNDANESTTNCQVIYSQFGLAIHQNDHQARRRFVEWAQNEIAVVPDFHKRILFSDEAHFWLNGYINKQNCRIWSEANPQVYVETPLHPEKLTV
ncbi:hypothetical protein TNCV_3797231 [Trichonephila clavipes]|nr:hypothetical protein TNCV_3797231 [Trichonephila clavipes]